MATDNIELLFRLRADSTPAIADLKKLRQVFESEIAGIKRVFSQRINLNVGTATGQGSQADAHVREFRRIEAEAGRSARVQEQEQVKLNRAVESLQRQRGAAFIRVFREEEQGAINAARTQEREAQRSATAQTQAAQQGARAQEREQTRLNQAVLTLQRQRSAALLNMFRQEERAATASARTQEREAARAARVPRSQVDAHVRDFRRIEAEAVKSARTQERVQANLNRSIESLQRQRSAALIRLFRQEEQEATKSARAQERAHSQAINAIRNSIGNLGSAVSRLGRTLSIGLTAPFAALGFASIRSARDIDSQVNTLRAFTGSAEAAEKRLAELIATAQKTPGLTTSLAATLDAQLRTAQVTEETINRVLPAIGRLNAVSRLGDPQRFAQNLAQLVTQNFERVDLKELVGQSPIAGEIIRELFNVDSPINSVAIKESAQRMGLTTTEAFFTAFAAAAQKNQALANVTESIGTRLEKMGDRISVALRPLGLAILNAVAPIIDQIVPLIERIGQAFAGLPQPIQVALIAIAGLVAALGPVLFVAGSVITALITVGGAIATAAAAVGGFAPLVAIAAAALIGLVGIFIQLLPAIAAVALGIAVLKRAWEENVGGIRDTVKAAFTEIQAFLSRIGTELLAVYKRVAPEIEATVSALLNSLRKFWDEHGESIVRIAKEAWEIIKPIIITAIRVIGDAIVFFLRVLRGDWKGAWDAAVDAVVRAVPAILNAGNRLYGLLVGILANILLAVGRWAIGMAIKGLDAAVRMMDAFVDYVQTQGVARAVAAVLAVAAALSSPTVLAAYALSGAAQAAAEARGREQAREAATAAEQEAAKAAAPQAGGTGTVDFSKRKAPATPATPGPGGAKGGGGGADDAARRRLKDISQDEAAAAADFRRTTEQIERDHKQRLINLEESIRQQKATSQSWLDTQGGLFDREAAEITRSVKNQKDRDQQLRDLEQKRTASKDEFVRKSNQLDDELKEGKDREKFARLEALAKAEDAANEGRITRIKDAADQERVTEEKASRDIGEIRLGALDRDLGLLRIRLAKEKEGSAEHITIQGEITAAEQEKQNASEEVDRNIASGRDKDLANARQHRDKLAQIYSSIAETIFQTQESAIRVAYERTVRALLAGSGNIRKALRDAELKRIEEEKTLAIAREEFRHATDAAEIQDGIDRLEKKTELNARELAELKALHAAREVEILRHKQAVADIESGAQEQFDDVVTKKAVPSSFDQLRKAVEEMDEGVRQTLAGGALDAMGLAFDKIGEAVGTAVEAFVLFGNAGTSVRKVTAEIIAAIAKQAAIKAVYHLAEGFAALAMAFFGIPNAGPSAAAHFQAAAIYASVAGIAAVAGRGVAGNSFQQQGAGAPATTGTPTETPATPAPKVQDIDRRAGPRTEVIQGGITTIITTEEVKRIGDQAITEANRQFQLEKGIRKERLESTLAGLREIRDAEVQGLEEQRRLRLAEEAATKGTRDRQAVADQIIAIDKRIQKAREQFISESATAQARAEEEERESVRDYGQARLAIFLAASQDRLRAIESEAIKGTRTREDAAIEANAIEAEQLRRRRENLEHEIALSDLPATRNELSVELSVIGGRQAELEVQEFQNLLETVTQSALTTEHDIQRAQEEQAGDRLQAENVELQKRKEIVEERLAIGRREAELEAQQGETLLSVKTRSALAAEGELVRIQQEGFRRRKELLESQRLGTVDLAEVQRVDDQLAILEAERTESNRVQAEKREQIISRELATLKSGLEAERVDLQRRKEMLEQQITIPALRLTETDDLERRQRVVDQLALIGQRQAEIEQQRAEDLLSATTKIALTQQDDLQGIQTEGYERRRANLATQKLDLVDLPEAERINNELVALEAEHTNTLQALSKRRQEILDSELRTIKRGLEREKAELQKRKETLEGELTLPAPTVETIPREALQQRQRLLDELVRLGARQAQLEIQQSEELLSQKTRMALAEQSALAEIQNEGLQKRKADLEGQRLQTIDPDEVASLTEELATLDAQRSTAQQEQAERRSRILGNELAAIKVALAAEQGEMESRATVLQRQLKIPVPKIAETPTGELERRQALLEEIAKVGGRQAELEARQVQDLLKAATRSAVDAEDQIGEIQEAVLRRRREALEQQKFSTIDPTAVRRIDGELQTIDARRSELERQQSERRKEIYRNEAESRFSFASNAEGLINLERSVSEQRLVAVQRIADARVNAEKEAADQITGIQQVAIQKQTKLISVQRIMVEGLLSSMNEVSLAGGGISKGLNFSQNAPVAQGLFSQPARQPVRPPDQDRQDFVDTSQRRDQVFPELTLRVEVTRDEGSTVRAVLDNYRSNGSIRNLILTDGQAS